MRRLEREARRPEGAAPAVAVLACTGCGSVVRVELGHGDLTCHCGADRRIMRIVEQEPRSPARVE